MKRLLQFSLLITTIIAIIISCAKEEPEVKKFNLTVSASEGGSVSTQGGVYVEGEIARVTATPSDGYVFSGWSNGSSDNPIQITMNSNTSITANFTKVKYAIDITVDGQGSVTEEVVSSGKEYDSGSVVKLTAVPSEGWLFSHWSGASNVIENTVELTADSNKSITAHFIEIPFEAISVGDGTIATELVYNNSNEVTAFKLTATTPVGWRFDGWTGGVQSSEMIIEVATDLAENVTATFIQVYDLTLNIVGEGEVTDEIITDTSKTFDAGTNVKLTAVPASGWRFDKWTGSVESNESVIVVNVDDAKEITATFIQVYDLTVTVEGEGAVTEEIVTTTDKTTSYDTGVTVKLTAEPAEGWRFDRWTGAIESTEAVVQVEMSEAKEVTATFAKIYDLNITIVGEGEVTQEIITETSKTYDAGSNIRLTAIPKDGWVFGGWSGSISNSTNVIEFNIEDHVSLIALFIDTSTYILRTTAIESKGFIVDVDTNSQLGWNEFKANTEVKIEAIPLTGYEFDGWIGDITSNQNPLIISIDKGYNIQAKFKNVIENELEIKFKTVQIPISDYPLYSFRNQTNGTKIVSIDSQHYFISQGSGWAPGMELPSAFQLKLDENGWDLFKVYNEAKFKGIRNDELIGSTLLFTDHDETKDDPEWRGHLWIADVSSEILKWTKVTQESQMSYFHGGGLGDVDGDGLLDVVGTAFDYKNLVNDPSAFFSISYQTGGPMIWQQNQNGSFSINSSFFPPQDLRMGHAAAQLADLNNNGKAELITGPYLISGDFDLSDQEYKENVGTFRIYQLDSESVYNQSFKSSSPNPFYDDYVDMGLTRIDSYDIDNDNLLDLIISREGKVNIAGDEGATLEFWRNKGDLSFEPTFVIDDPNYSPSGAGLVFDVNKDGFLDFVIKGGQVIYQESENNNPWESYIDLGKLIFINNGNGTFRNYDKSILLKGYDKVEVIPYERNGKLSFFLSHSQEDGCPNDCGEFHVTTYHWTDVHLLKDLN